MSLVAIALALATADAPQVKALRVASVGSRTAVQLLTSDGVPAPSVLREGPELVVRCAAPAAPDLVIPAPLVPIEAIRVAREAEATVVRIRVAAGVAFEASQDGGTTTLMLGEGRPTPPAIAPELYARLFPTGFQPPAEPPEPPPRDGKADAFALGRVSLRPSVQTTWVDADVTAFGPQPVRDHYLQLSPTLALGAPVLDGQLGAEYEPRLRYFSQLPQVGDTSHLLGAHLELPLGSRLSVRAGHRYTRATLEASLVDPGREYFFDLTPYTLHESSLSAKEELGPRLFAEAEGRLRSSHFDREQAGFVGYDSRALRAALGYDLGRELKAVLSYTLEHVPPPPARPIVETTAHAISAALRGPLGPLMRAAVSAGYRTQTSPQASDASRTFSGLVFGGSLKRDLGRSTSVELQLNRAATVSAFETNAYYVTSSAGLSLTAPLPYEAWCRASGSWLRNSYPNPAREIGAPRRDDVVGWSAGFGRRLGRRASLQGDYRRERRQSNLPGYDVTMSGLTLQVAVGFAGAGR